MRLRAGLDHSEKVHWVGRELQPKTRLIWGNGWFWRASWEIIIRKKCLELEFFGGQVYCPRVWGCPRNLTSGKLPWQKVLPCWQPCHFFIHAWSSSPCMWLSMLLVLYQLLQITKKRGRKVVFLYHGATKFWVVFLNFILLGENISGERSKDMDWRIGDEEIEKILSYINITKIVGALTSKNPSKVF